MRRRNGCDSMGKRPSEPRPSGLHPEESEVEKMAQPSV